MATLYRKYRSQRFDEVIGQEPIITTLTNQIKLGRIGHAYLFTGSRGIGKTTCARIFARAVNCLHPVDGSPCGECEVCKKLASPDNVDIIEMDAASNNGVDDARDIREKVKYMPVSCRYKVYIIDEVHMLTGGAFNALLKTIEEPPEHIIFILATTEPQKLPQTILSRCIRFDFKLVPPEVLAEHIKRVYDAEKVKYTPDAVEEIARLGAGSVRDALSVADALMSAADVITRDVVLSLTGAGDNATVAELFDAAASGDLAGAINGVDKFAKSGKSMSAVAAQLTSYARNALVIKSVGESAISSGIVNADKETASRMGVSAAKFPLEKIARALESFSAAESGLKYSVDPRVFLETALVKLIGDANTEADLRRRVAALERTVSALGGEQKKNNLTPPVKQASQAYSAPPIEAVPPPSQLRREQPQTPPKAPPQAAKPAAPERKATREPEVKLAGADEGEFMHGKAGGVSGLTLLGKVAGYLRKKGTLGAERARELLSRGVTVKERDDVIAFVAHDDTFLLLSERSVTEELDEALNALGVRKFSKIQKTEEDMLADDIAKARELFGKTNVNVRG